MLVWLSVWRKVQTVCVWSSWCHCIPKPHHILPDSNPDWQNVPEHFSSSVLRKKTYKTPQNVSVHVTAKSNRQYGHTSKSNVFSTSCLIWSGVVMRARVSWCLHTHTRTSIMCAAVRCNGLNPRRGLSFYWHGFTAIYQIILYTISAVQLKKLPTKSNTSPK